MGKKINRRMFMKTVGVGAVGVAASQINFPTILAQTQKDFFQPATLKVGIVPFISSGPIFLAQARGYFEKVGLTFKPSIYMDGALAIPSLVAGEIDLTASTSNAGLFNAISKGAPYKIGADRGQEKPGSGSISVVVSNKMYDAGITSSDQFDQLAGKTFGIQAPGSIDNYILSRAMQKIGADPRKDVNWSSGATYPDMIKIMGLNRLDVAVIPVPLAFLAEKRNVGKIIGWASDIEPNVQLASWVVNNQLMQSNRSAIVRFFMVHMYAAMEFNAAAAQADADAVAIIAKAVRLPPPVVKSAAPRWTWMAEDGIPNIESVMAQSQYWTSYYSFVKRQVSEEEVFSLEAAQEAAERLSQKNPFI